MKFKLSVMLRRDVAPLFVEASGTINEDESVTIEKVVTGSAVVDLDEKDIREIKKAAWQYQDAKNEEWA